VERLRGRAVRERRGLVARQNDLGGAESREGLLQPVRRHRFEDELAGAQVHRREADVAALPERDDPIVPAPGYPALHQHGARGQRLHDLPPDQALGEAGILDLLADGDAVSGRHELAQVVRRGLHRHAGERDAVSARGQRDLQDPRGQLGVLIEHFVEIADPIKEDSVRTLRLYLAPMLEHRRGRSTSGLAAHGRHGVKRGDWRDIRWRI
jgi:hypothetical protein